MNNLENKKQYVIDRLGDYARHPEISFKSGVSLSTLNNIRNGKDVKNSTLDKVYKAVSKMVF